MDDEVRAVVGERFTTGIHLRSYTFDAKNSSFEAVKNSADQSSFVVSAHYQNPRASLPPAPTSTPASSPFPPFTTLPDARSLFLGYTYSLAKLPEPMLHLQGYDHDTVRAARIMEARETAILAALAIADPYANDRMRAPDAHSVRRPPRARSPLRAAARAPR